MGDMEGIIVEMDNCDISDDETKVEISNKRPSKCCSPSSRICRAFAVIARRLCTCNRRRQKGNSVEIVSSQQNGLTIHVTGERKVEPVEVVCTSPPRSEGPETTSPLASPDCTIPSIWVDRSPRPSRVSTMTEGENSLFSPREYSWDDCEEAQERLLSRMGGWWPEGRDLKKPCRYYTLKRKKRKKFSTSQLLKSSDVLDDAYNGLSMCVLKGADSWDFNAFLLDNACGGKPVPMLCVYLLHQHELFTYFKLDPVAVWKCFSLIEESYHSSNPYHNAVHAADVTQAMHCFLREKAIQEHLTPLEKFASIIAAVCHDLDHPGVNQPFLIATDNHLASLYNNASVLENHHWRCAMGCIWESGLLDNWSRDDIEKFQYLIRSLILATDMARQNEFLQKFVGYRDQGTLDLEQVECRHFLLQIALKCADICNPCRPWETSRLWSHRICDELYRQGDYERQLQLPITSICDRYVNSVATIQSNFIKFLAAPLFEAWHQWLKSSLSDEMLSLLRMNEGRWEEAIKLGDTTGCAFTSSSVSQPTSVPKTDTLEAVSEDLRQSWARRHSMPAPSSSARTIIRRESLSSDDNATPLVLETLAVGKEVVDAVLTVKTPSPSSISIQKGRRSTPMAKGQRRRRSLPPLWDPKTPPPPRPFQPLPPTPLEEELPFPLDDADVRKERSVDDSNSSGCSRTIRGSNGTAMGSSGDHRAGNSSKPRHGSLQETDKENLLPVIHKVESGVIKQCPQARLFNHDEIPELANKSTMLLKSKSQNKPMGRRGSAPLLKYEELRCGLKLLPDRENNVRLQKRRGSAPANQLTNNMGSESMLHQSKDRTPLLPLKSKENLNPDLERSFGSFLLPPEGRSTSVRRSSAPWDRPRVGGDLSVFSLGSNGVKMTEKELLRKFSEGGVGLSMGMALCEQRGGVTGGGCGIGGGSLTPHHFDVRRGSAGFELMSGLWRLRIERQDTSLCSDDSVNGFSSSDCASPGTPGVQVGLTPLFQGPPGPYSSVPVPMIRRGSLPTDIFIGGDRSRWTGSTS